MCCDDGEQFQFFFSLTLYSLFVHKTFEVLIHVLYADLGFVLH